MGVDIMIYEVDDILEASVTKSRPAQKVGLELEEYVAKGEQFRIFVVGVGGLFKKNNVDVRTGDELLEVNGIAVTNRVEFPKGIKDVKRFFKGEWSINVRVGRNNYNYGCDTSTTEELTPQNSNSNLIQQQQQQDVSGHSRVPENPLVGDRWGGSLTPRSRDDSGHPRDAVASETSSAKRRGRRKSRESIGTLIRDIRSLTPSGHERGVWRGKRLTRDRSESGHIRSTSIKKTVSWDTTSGHSRSASKRKKTKERKMSKTENNNNNDNKQKEKGNSEDRIHDVDCTKTEVTLEMNDGKRVSVDPEALMALFTEEDGKFVAISIRTLDDRPALERLKNEQPMVVPISDDKDSKQSNDEPLDAPKLQSLRNLLEKSVPMEEEKESLNHENRPSKPEVKNLMSKNNKDNYNSRSNLVRDPWIRRSMSTLLEEEESCCNKSTVNISNGQRPSSPGSLSLRELLGERLKKTNPKKWEESSMVSSTFACMTNLIDPGDLMKIRNFSVRPGLNGATVEVVCKSQRSNGNRWDVRVIQRKNQRATTSDLDSNRLISVAAENLRHFV